MKNDSSKDSHRTKSSARLRLALAAGSFAAVTSICGLAQASVMFSDTSYNPLNYTQPFNYNATGSSSVFATVPMTGLRFTITTLGPPNAPAVLDGVLNTTFVYDPATQGAITSISASASKTFTATNVSPTGTEVTFGNNFRPLVEQDGKFYTTAIAGPSLGPITGGSTATIGPDTLSKSGLAANDFVLIDTTTGMITGTTGLNFDGDVLTFGLVQLLNSTDQNTPISAMTTYADLRIGVTSLSAVPLPASAPMFGVALLAVGGIGYRVKRRRSAA